jgi:tetraprenyl-beta-curcumene synthase
MEYSSTPRGGSRPAHGFVREAPALLLVGIVYWLQLQPLARSELRRWRERARAIPDDSLRRCAQSKLSDEALNPEAAALFAVLAPRAERRRVATFIVAFQILYDYLDAVNELPGRTDLATGLQLNQALSDALSASRQAPRSTNARAHGEDGGYVNDLVGECRRTLGELPPHAARLLGGATARCAQAQSHNHAYTASRDARLERWSRAQASPATAYEWWELAAGGISCLAIHALVACAADDCRTRAHLPFVERAYFPSICALSALLDSVADLAADAASENHSFVSHYRDADHAATRLLAIAQEATMRLAALPHAARHRVIMVGICSYYLSFDGTLTGFPTRARRALLADLGWLCAPMLSVMRLRRWLRHRQTASRGRLEPGAAAPRLRSSLAARARAACRRESSQPAQGSARSQV